MENHAKSESQPIWATEAAGERGSHPGGLGSLGQNGERSRPESVALAGTIREGGDYSNPHNSVSGGIIAQLIRFEEDRLGEADACIQWYEDEKAKVRQRIADLRELQRLERAEREELQ